MDKTVEFLENMVALSNTFLSNSTDGFRYEKFEKYISDREKLIEEYKTLEIDEKPSEARKVYEKLEKLDNEIKAKAEIYLEQIKLEMSEHKDDKAKQVQNKQNLRKMKKYFGMDKPVDPYYFDRKK